MALEGDQTKKEEYGTALFGACYYKYFMKRREAQAKIIKQIRSGQLGDRVLTEDEKAIAGRSLLRMGVGSVAGGISVYFLRQLQKRVTRTAPSFLLTGALCAAGSVAGAIGGISVSSYYEMKTLKGLPLKIEEEECPAFLEFAPCVMDRDCVNASSKSPINQRLLSGYHQCKTRAMITGQ